MITRTPPDQLDRRQGGVLSLRLNRMFVAGTLPLGTPPAAGTGREKRGKWPACVIVVYNSYTSACTIAIHARFK